MGQLIRFPERPRAHQRPTEQRENLAVARVVELRTHRLRFRRGWLRCGDKVQRLTPEQAGDLSQCLYWASATSTPGEPSRSEPAPGLIVEGRGRAVTIKGFGRPLIGESLHSLITELHNFYERRRRRGL